MKVSHDTPVLIIGAGPVGLALALDLAWHGQRSMIVEKAPEVGEVLAKAGGLNERTLEFCRRWGIKEQVYDWGQPQDYPRDTAFCVSLAGQYIGRDPLPSLKDWPERDSSPEKWRKCPQYIFDPILAEAALKTGLVDIHYEGEMLSFTQDENGVTATVAFKGEQEPHQVRASYMVGCDGAASQVRQALDIPFEGKTLDHSLSLMLKIDHLERYHDMGRCERFMFVGTEGTWANMTSVDFMQLWRFTMVGSEDRLDPSKMDLPAIVRRAFGRDDIPFAILRTAPWRRSQCAATRYRSGRVLIAGDAAHTTSPTGGHGLNTGLGDVFGLGWMLDAMLCGWGGPHLLDAYGQERRSVAIRNASSSTRNYQAWVGGSPDFSRVKDIGPDGDAARERLTEHFVRMLYPEWHSYGIAMGYRYDDSPIIVPDGTPADSDDPSQYLQTARPGHRAPHAWLEPDRSTIELFGHGFVLLRFDSTVEVTALETEANRAGLPLTVVTLDRPDIAALYEKRLCLVRPDGHSAWRGDALPPNVKRLVDRVRGALAPHFEPQTAE
ncbi:FAD-dependent monooxygenase [Pseudomonas fluorescens]|nr:FAD-dependent monooxygenase [Pseudomonas fluorescens]